jgi:hypothetical protein
MKGFQKNMNRFGILFLIGLILAGCRESPKHPNIFQNPICKPPCWETIAPGTTTKDEALVILSKIDAIDQPAVDLNRSDLTGFDDEIQFALHEDNNGYAGWIYFLDNQVSMIAFQANQSITLQQAIELFGAPQSVLVIHAGEFDGVTLLNPDSGIAFNYKSKKQLSEIKPSDEIDGVYFFDPKQYPNILASGVFSYYQLDAEETLGRLRAWKGYGALSQYEK